VLVAYHPWVLQAEDSALLEPLRVAFYDSLHTNYEKEWSHWIRGWMVELQAQHGEDAGASVTHSMKLASPKYIPRE